MRKVIQLVTTLVALVGLLGLLGAKVLPLQVADDEAEEDEGPSFYALILR